ncbi:uncharacterized protein LOC121055179 [Oryza brachyantha]|uniref:uncharacterized protein LOC121055179 n=1 Tax=Oryza brachyantha TaxID=4533 RepID=UPI001ADB67E2|nr:uncharacterized protein LOC121055179 [Oryza brachyantha]
MATTQAAARADVDDGDGNAAANRRNGAHAVLMAASALVGLLPSANGEVRALVLLLLLLLGCTVVVLSMGGRRHVAYAAAPRADRSTARLRWTGFHALLLLGGCPLLLGPTYWPAAVPRPQRQLAQVLVAYALLVLGAALVLLSAAYDGVPRSVRPAAAAAARGLDGLLFGGRFAPPSDADDD